MFVRALITGAAPSPYIYISGFVYYAIKLSIKLWKMENEEEIVRIRIFEVEEIPEKKNQLGYSQGISKLLKSFRTFLSLSLSLLPHLSLFFPPRSTLIYERK